MKKTNKQNRTQRRAQSNAVANSFFRAEQSAEKHTAQSTFFEKYERAEQTAEQQKVKKQNCLTVERNFTKTNILSVMHLQQFFSYEREKKNVVFYSCEQKKNAVAIMFTSKVITVMSKVAFDNCEYHSKWEHKFVTKVHSTKDMLVAVNAIIKAYDEKKVVDMQTAEQTAESA